MIRRWGTSGATFMEVIISTGLISVALLSIISVFIGGLQLMSKGEEITGATEVARATLEAIKEMPFERIPEGTASFDGKLDHPPTGDGFPPAPYPSMVVDNRTLYIKVDVAPRGLSLKGVTVEVSFGREGRVVQELFLHP